MTLKDYEFLISTMETIVSLDIKSEALNGEKREMISKKTNLDDEISIITNRIEEVQRWENSVNSRWDGISELDNLISKNRTEINELETEISKLDTEIRSQTRGKAFEEWGNFADKSTMELLGLGIFIGISNSALVIGGISYFSESFNETFAEYFWYVIASFCVISLFCFTQLLQMRAEDKKIMPDLRNWEDQRKKLVSDLEEINEITNQKDQAKMDLLDTLYDNAPSVTSLEEEDQKLESLRVSLRECLSEIEAIEVELSRINDEIVNSLESVAHLTPYNSGL